VPRNNEKILVTGGTGFLGSHVVSMFMKNNFDVAVLKRKKSDTSRLKFLCQNLSTLKLFDGDVTDIDSLKFIIKNFEPDTIIHCAAYGVNYEEQNTNIAQAINVTGTINLLSACIGSSVRYIVNIGTSYEYGDQCHPISPNSPYEPCNLYGKSKLEQFYVFKEYNNLKNTKMIHLRPFTMFGPLEREHKFLPLILKNLLDGKSIDLTKGEQMRNYVYVSDIAEFIFEMNMDNMEKKEEINLYSENNFSLKHFGNLVSNKFKHKGILNWGNLPYRDDEIMNNYADNYSPILNKSTTIDTAIAETIEINRLYYGV
jgi:UDP-glucose 4-epimerase